MYTSTSIGTEFNYCFLEAASSIDNSGDGIDPVSGGVLAAGVNITLADEFLTRVSKYIHSLQADSKALKLGLNYSDEIAKVAKYIKYAKFSAYTAATVGTLYDTYNTFGPGATMTESKFWTNVGFTGVGFGGIPGAIISVRYYTIDTFYKGGVEGFNNDNAKIQNDFKNATSGFSMRSLMH